MEERVITTFGQAEVIHFENHDDGDFGFELKNGYCVEYQSFVSPYPFLIFRPHHGLMTHDNRFKSLEEVRDYFEDSTH